MSEPRRPGGRAMIAFRLAQRRRGKFSRWRPVKNLSDATLASLGYETAGQAFVIDHFALADRLALGWLLHRRAATLSRADHERLDSLLVSCPRMRAFPIDLDPHVPEGCGITPEQSLALCVTAAIALYPHLEAVGLGRPPLISTGGKGAHLVHGDLGGFAHPLLLEIVGGLVRAAGRAAGIPLLSEAGPNRVVGAVYIDDTPYTRRSTSRGVVWQLEGSRRENGRLARRLDVQPGAPIVPADPERLAAAATAAEQALARARDDRATREENARRARERAQALSRALTSIAPDGSILDDLSAVAEAMPRAPGAPGEHRPRDPLASLAAYGAAALRGACQRIAAAAPGARNTTVHREAWSIGRLCHAPARDPSAPPIVEEGVAYGELYAAALSTGLPADEAARTIQGGLDAGRTSPREPPERQAWSPAKRVAERLRGRMSEPFGSRARGTSTSTAREDQNQNQDLESQEIHSERFGHRVQMTRDQLARTHLEHFPPPGGETFCVRPHMHALQDRLCPARTLRAAIGCHSWRCAWCAGELRAYWYRGVHAEWAQSEEGWIVHLDPEEVADKRLQGRVERHARRHGGKSLSCEQADGSAILLSTIRPLLDRATPVPPEQRQLVLLKALRETATDAMPGSGRKRARNPVRAIGWHKAVVLPEGTYEHIGPCDRDQSAAEARDATVAEAEAASAPCVIRETEHGLEAVLLCTAQERLEILARAIALRPTAAYLARHGLTEPQRWIDEREAEARARASASEAVWCP